MKFIMYVCVCIYIELGMNLEIKLIYNLNFNLYYNTKKNFW